MPVISESIAALPPLQRRMAEAWLTRFEENWHDQKLRECMRALPVQSSLRRPLLLAMIERDLAHHWADGRSIAVESYFKEFPELGGADELPVELIAAEYALRQKHGGADLADFAERFPSRIDDLYVLVKPTLFEAESRRGATRVEDSFTARRLELLRAPADAGSSDPVSERRLELLRSSIPDANTLPTDAPESQALLQTDVPTNSTADVDVFRPLESAGAAPAEAAGTSAALPTWPDVESLRDRKAPVNLPGSKDRPASAPAPTLPPTLGRYRIERRLGTSGLGTLYLAVDTALDRRVALKVPFFGGASADVEQAQFQREARAIAGLSHPLLCPVFDVGQAEGFDFLVMPYIEGDSLQVLMKQRPIWPVRQAVELVRKLAIALDAAHHRGVLHRDLKPTNIVIGPTETPVVVGFGQSTPPEHSRRTGNSIYVAPEQAPGKADLVGPHSDVYSLGVIFYQMLTGQLPPAVNSGLRPVFPGDLDVALQSICRKAMAAEADQRYATMRELVEELSRYGQTALQSDADVRLPFDDAKRRGPTLAPSAIPARAGAPAGQAPPMLGPVAARTAAPAPPVRVARSRDRFTSATRRRTPARPHPWKWALIGAAGVLLLILIVTALVKGRDRSEQADDAPPANPAPDGQAAASRESADDLVRALQSGSSSDRAAVVERIRRRKDVETADALAQFIAQGEWSAEQAPNGETRDAAIAALLAVDPLKVPAALKRAARSEDARVRTWSYREAARRLDADNQSVPLPVLLGGFKDADPRLRTLVAEQVRQLRSSEPSVVSALLTRVCDDVWGETSAESTAHNPRADGGKDAALEALEELAPERVAAALNIAARSSNPDVRLWAERQKKRRSS